MSQPSTAFAPGDNVMLSSGGPGMTVLDVGAHTGLVWCRWMGEGGDVREYAFPAQALRRDPRAHLHQP